VPSEGNSPAWKQSAAEVIRQPTGKKIPERSRKKKTKQMQRVEKKKKEIVWKKFESQNRGDGDKKKWQDHLGKNVMKPLSKGNKKKVHWQAFPCFPHQLKTKRRRKGTAKKKGN